MFSSERRLCASVRRGDRMIVCARCITYVMALSLAKLYIYALPEVKNFDNKNFQNRKMQWGMVRPEIREKAFFATAVRMLHTGHKCAALR
mgnify:CR=1